MNDFDYDCLQKKRIAQGERHRKKATRRCTMPSDYLTAAQKRKLNGEVMTYSLKDRLTWRQFKGLPDDLKREYLKGLEQDYGATSQEIADMFGMSKSAVQTVKRSLGIASKNGHPFDKTKEQKEGWEEFLGQKYPASAMIQKETKVAETSPTATEKDPLESMPTAIWKETTAESKIDAIAEMLKKIASASGMEFNASGLKVSAGNVKLTIEVTL